MKKEDKKYIYYIIFLVENGDEELRTLKKAYNGILFLAVTFNYTFL